VSFKKPVVSLVLASMLILMSASALLAHSQVVTPPGRDVPVVSGPISNPWAQAHCNAASPGIIADRSNGVVQFLPAAALPCPAVANPGGQVHGD
jgi:hypothetical protein